MPAFAGLAVPVDAPAVCGRVASARHFRGLVFVTPFTVRVALVVSTGASVASGRALRAMALMESAAVLVIDYRIVPAKPAVVASASVAGGKAHSVVASLSTGLTAVVIVMIPLTLMIGFRPINCNSPSVIFLKFLRKSSVSIFRHYSPMSKAVLFR